jgi:hypothetical protein
MRIRPLHIALFAVVGFAVWATAGVVASFAELRSVGQRVTSATRARSQSAPRQQAAVAPEAAPPVDETANGAAERDDALDRNAPGAAALDPSAAPFRLDDAVGRSPLPGENEQPPGFEEDQGPESFRDSEPTFDDPGEDAVDGGVPSENER